MTLIDNSMLTSGGNMTRYSVNAGEQIVGRERRERLSQLTWCGKQCFDSLRAAASTQPLGCFAVASRGTIRLRKNDDVHSRI